MNAGQLALTILTRYPAINQTATIRTSDGRGGKAKHI